MKYFFKNTNGSIMMEAVIVLPLYMLLFGAMMLLGDLVLGGVSLFNANRMLAWGALDLFGDYDTALIARVRERFGFTNVSSQSGTASTQSTPSTWFFDEQQRSMSDWAGIFKQPAAGGSEYIPHNSRIALFRGSMPLRMENIPPLYRGALALNDIMNRPDEVSGSNSNKQLLFKQKFDLGQNHSFAHYLVKRLPEDERNIEASELALTGKWIDIAYENWVQRTDTQTLSQQSTNNNNNNNSNTDAGYARGLEYFAADLGQ